MWNNGASAGVPPPSAARTPSSSLLWRRRRGGCPPQPGPVEPHGGTPQTPARVPSPPARAATASPTAPCPHDPGRAYLRLVARPVLKLGSAAHGLPPVVDHLPAGLAGTPGEVRRCGAQRRRRGRGLGLGARSARRLPASVPSAGAARASGRACAGVRVCVPAGVCAGVCGRQRERERESRRPPAACPPLALRAVPARGSRASPCALLSLFPPPFLLLNLRVFFVSYSLCLLLLLRSPSDTHAHTADGDKLHLPKA